MKDFQRDGCGKDAVIFTAIHPHSGMMDTEPSVSIMYGMFAAFFFNIASLKSLIEEAIIYHR